MPSARHNQARVDAVTRAILYPWVREALVLLAITRAEIKAELTELRYAKAMLTPTTEVRQDRLRSFCDDIDRVLAQADACESPLNEMAT